MNSNGKLRICNALFKLMSQKELEDITIKEIVHEAGISRTTFYYHFQQISDILTYITDYLLEGISSRAKVINVVDGRETPGAIQATKPVGAELFQFIYANRHMFQAIFQSPYCTEFRAQLRETSYNIVSTYDFYFSSEDKKSFFLGKPYMDYWKEMQASIFMGMLECWMRRDFTETPEELVDIYLYISTLSYHSAEKKGTWPKLEDAPTIRYNPPQTP